MEVEGFYGIVSITLVPVKTTEKSSQVPPSGRRRRWLGTTSIDLPEINCAQPTKLPSVTGQPGLWANGEQPTPFASTLAGLLTRSLAEPPKPICGDTDPGQIPGWVKELLGWWAQRATVDTLKWYMFKSNAPQRLVWGIILSLLSRLTPIVTWNSWYSGDQAAVRGSQQAGGAGHQELHKMWQTNAL